MSYPAFVGPVPLQSGRPLRRRSNLRAILACSIAAWAVPAAMAQTLSWDTDPATTGAQTGSGTWGGTMAWLNGLTNQAWVNGVDAVIPASGGSNFTIDVGNVAIDDLTGAIGYTLQNGTLTFAGGEESHVISGGARISAVVAGSEGVAIGNGGMIYFSGANTYSGPTVVGLGTNPGFLTISGGNAIPDTSTITMAPNGEFHVLNSETIGALETNNFTSSVTAVELSTGVTLTTGANGGSTNYLGRIIGSGGLRKIGTGTFTARHTALPYSGDTVVDEGKLILISAPSGQFGQLFPAINPQSKVSIAAGAALQFSTIAGNVASFSGLTGTGKLEMGFNKLTLNGAAGTFSGEISGSGGITIGSSSSVTFAGLNSFTQNLEVSGTLSVPAVADTGINSPIGAGGTLVLNNGAKFILATPGVHSTNRAVQLSSASSSHTATIEVVDGATLGLSGAINGGVATLRKVGPGTLSLIGGQPGTAKIRLDEGVLAISNSSFRGVELSGSGTVDLVEGSLHMNAAAGAFTGIIRGSGSLLIGSAVLEGMNTFSGGLTVATLTVPNFNATGTPGPLGTGAVTVLGGLFHSGQTDVTSDRPFNIGLGAKFGMTGSNTLTLTGLFSGEGGIAAVGWQSILQLTNPANSFTGPAGADQSSLRVEDIPMSGVNSPIGAGNTIAIKDGNLIFAGHGDFTTDRLLNLTGNAAVRVESAGTSLRFGRATGSGALIKAGAGRLIQTEPTSDFAGTASIEEGILVTGPLVNYGIPSGLGKGFLISLGNNYANGELRLLDGVGGETNRNLMIRPGGGRVQISNSTVTFKGQFRGPGSLVLSGNDASNSTFVLNSINHSPASEPHTGPLVIESATVRATGTGSLGEANRIVLADNRGSVLQVDASENIGSLHGGGGPNFGRVALNAPLATGGDNSDSTFGGVIEGAATLTKIGQGILTLTGANTFTAALVVSGGTVAFPASTGIGSSPLGNASSVQLKASRLRYTGAGLTSVSQSLLVESLATLDVPEANSTLVWSGSVSSIAPTQFSPDTLIKEGAGTLRLSGANGWDGSTMIDAGKLQVIGSNALPNEGMVTVASGAALELLPGTSETIGALQGAGHLALGGQKLTVGGTNTSMAFAGPISGGGASQLEKTGSGTLTLSNPNSSFTGGVIISDGAISVPSVANIGVNSPLGSNGPIILGDSRHAGRLIITGENPGATNRAIVLTSGGAAVEVTHPDAEFELGGSISGPGSLLKLGAGSLKLSSPLGGPIVVAAGTLTLNTNISGSAGTATIIAPGILDTPADSTHGVGNLNILGGTIAPGGTEEIGMLTTEGVTFDSGIFDIGLQGTSLTQYDSLHVNGVVTLNGPVELSIGLGFDPADWTDVFRIVVNDGNDAINLNGPSGRFAYQGNLLEDGEHFLVNDGGVSQYFFLDYGTAGENDIELHAAPEPGSASLILIAGVGLFTGRRRESARASARV